MPGELVGDHVVVRDVPEAHRIYNKGQFGRPMSGGGLQLDLVEAAYLVEHGRLRLADGAESVPRFFTTAATVQDDFEIRYLAYREFRERGRGVVMPSPGLRAQGIHFRLLPTAAQKAGPSTYVRALSERAPADVDGLVSFARKCTADGMEGFVAIVDEESEVTVYEAGLHEPQGKTPAATKPAKEATLVVDRVIVWDKADAARLHSAEFFGKPLGGGLHLSLVEALHLSGRGQGLVDAKTGKALSEAQLLKLAKKIEPGIELRRRVFDDLKARHLVVKTGYKFGAHFRAYEADPEGSHAPYLVHGVHADDVLEWPALSRAVRLAHGVRKTLLLAVPQGAHVHYLRLTRAR